MNTVIVLALLVPQDAHVQQLIQKLGDTAPSVRQEAEQALRNAGLAAEESLKAARENRDPEIRMRVERLLSFCKETRRREAIERQQRPRKLRLVTVDVVDTPLGTVLEELTKQTGIRFDANTTPLDRRITLKATRMPLIQAMHQLGLTYDRHWKLVRTRLKEIPPPKHTAYTQGIGLTFFRIPWMPDAKRKGVIFKTHIVQDYFGDLDWKPTVVSGGKEPEVERCGKHSPELLYVPDPDLGEAKVVVKGLRRWFCDVPVDFKEPKGGATRRVGSYEIMVGWPVFRVRADKPVLRSVLENTLAKSDITVRYKPREGAGHFGARLGAGETWLPEAEVATRTLFGAAAPTNLHRYGRKLNFLWYANTPSIYTRESHTG